MPTKFAAQAQENGVWYVVCHTCGTKDAVTTVTPDMTAMQVDVAMSNACDAHDRHAGHASE